MAAKSDVHDRSRPATIWTVPPWAHPVAAVRRRRLEALVRIRLGMCPTSRRLGDSTSYWDRTSGRTPVAIRAVMFDFGGVISTSPFEAFARLEIEQGLPPDFIRTVNATNPHDNAGLTIGTWRTGRRRLRSGVGQRSARARGHEVDGRLVLERLGGRNPPPDGRRHQDHAGSPTRQPA